TVLSLGCQHAQADLLRKEVLKRDPAFSKPVFVLEQQQSRSEFAMISQAIQETFAGLVAADKYVREPAPLSAITVGLKCGGSDGFSGISANPAIGQKSDLAAASGGKAIPSGVRECGGVGQGGGNGSSV